MVVVTFSCLCFQFADFYDFFLFFKKHDQSVKLFVSRSGILGHISVKLFGSRSGSLVRISVKLFVSRRVKLDLDQDHWSVLSVKLFVSRSGPLVSTSVKLFESR